MDIYVQLTRQQLIWAASRHKSKEYMLQQIPSKLSFFPWAFLERPICSIFIPNIWKEVRNATIILGTMASVLVQYCLF